MSNFREPKTVKRLTSDNSTLVTKVLRHMNLRRNRKISQDRIVQQCLRIKKIDSSCEKKDKYNNSISCE